MLAPTLPAQTGGIMSVSETLSKNNSLGGYSKTFNAKLSIFPINLLRHIYRYMMNREMSLIAHLIRLKSGVLFAN